ncbi:uncharacterized protein LOC135375942 [Ornithodoros turicata]|uniref:uncharacterized protein LOC135375942 n=1 Tax=Ornithodoros turicata TaxID=34597 RepID=UPI003139FFA2
MSSDADLTGVVGHYIVDKTDALYGDKTNSAEHGSTQTGVSASSTFVVCIGQFSISSMIGFGSTLFVSQDLPPTDSSLLCSLHFLQDAYTCSQDVAQCDLPAQRRRLKPDAVPMELSPLLQHDKHIFKRAWEEAEKQRKFLVFEENLLHLFTVCLGETQLVVDVIGTRVKVTTMCKSGHIKARDGQPRIGETSTRRHSSSSWDPVHWKQPHRSHPAHTSCLSLLLQPTGIS